MTTPNANSNGTVREMQNGGKDALSGKIQPMVNSGGMAKTANGGSNGCPISAEKNGAKPVKRKTIKRRKRYRIGLGVRQQEGYGKLDRFNSRVGVGTGILQLILSLEAVTLGALQVYFRHEYASILNVMYVWPSVVLCILSGIFGALSNGKHTYVVFLYMVVSLFACLTSCMMFGLEVNSSMVLQANCTSHLTSPSTSQEAFVSTTSGPKDNTPECANYGLNLAIAVILAVIAFLEILISFVAAVYSSKVMCSQDNHQELVDECLSDEDDEEPPPNAGLPQIRRAQKR